MMGNVDSSTSVGNSGPILPLREHGKKMRRTSARGDGCAAKSGLTTSCKQTLLTRDLAQTVPPACLRATRFCRAEGEAQRAASACAPSAGGCVRGRRMVTKVR
eukprot:6172381-Pleurochrysis_carterae.AAC.7